LVQTRRLSREPIENLEELKLVVEIVLEPEHDLLMLPKCGHGFIPPPKLGNHLLVGAPTAILDEPGTDLTEFVSAQRRRNRSLVERVAPRQDGSHQTARRDPFGRTVAVRDVEHL